MYPSKWNSTTQIFLALKNATGFSFLQVAKGAKALLTEHLSLSSIGLLKNDQATSWISANLPTEYTEGQTTWEK